MYASWEYKDGGKLSNLILNEIIYNCLFKEFAEKSSIINNFKVNTIQVYT